jgi:hydrogenase maturation protein HypF
VLQNRTLFEGIAEELRQRGLVLLAQRQVPANDGGLALGQALIAEAKTNQVVGSGSEGLV